MPGGSVNYWTRAIRKREPILRRKRDAPGITGKLQLQGNLKELAHSTRALNPCNTAADGTRRLPSLRVRHLEAHPHIFQDVVLRLIAAAVAIDDESRGALIKRPTESIHTRNAQRNGLNNSRAATLTQLRSRAGYTGSGHKFTHIFGKFPAKFVHECRPPIIFLKSFNRPTAITSSEYFPTLGRDVLRLRTSSLP